MKKLILFCLLMVAMVATQAQVKLSEGVKSYHYSDSLKKNATITQYYYIPDFCENYRLQTDCDTLSAGYIKVSTIVYGSLDYSNWVSIDTLVTAGSGASATGNALNTNIYYNYLKVVSKAVDSTQYVDYKYKLLIDKN